MMFQMMRLVKYVMLPFLLVDYLQDFKGVGHRTAHLLLRGGGIFSETIPSSEMVFTGDLQ